MQGIAINEIEGAMVEKKTYNLHASFPYQDLCDTFNKALDANLKELLVVVKEDK